MATHGEPPVKPVEDSGNSFQLNWCETLKLPSLQLTMTLHDAISSEDSISMKQLNPSIDDADESITISFNGVFLREKAALAAERIHESMQVQNRSFFRKQVKLAGDVKTFVQWIDYRIRELLLVIYFIALGIDTTAKMLEGLDCILAILDRKTFSKSSPADQAFFAFPGNVISFFDLEIAADRLMYHFGSREFGFLTWCAKEKFLRLVVKKGTFNQTYFDRHRFVLEKDGSKSLFLPHGVSLDTLSDWILGCFRVQKNKSKIYRKKLSEFIFPLPKPVEKQKSVLKRKRDLKSNLSDSTASKKSKSSDVALTKKSKSSDKIESTRTAPTGSGSKKSKSSDVAVKRIKSSEKTAATGSGSKKSKSSDVAVKKIKSSEKTAADGSGSKKSKSSDVAVKRIKSSEKTAATGSGSKKSKSSDVAVKKIKSSESEKTAATSSGSKQSKTSESSATGSTKKKETKELKAKDELEGDLVDITKLDDDASSLGEYTSDSGFCSVDSYVSGVSDSVNRLPSPAFLASGGSAAFHQIALLNKRVAELWLMVRSLDPSIAETLKSQSTELFGLRVAALDRSLIAGQDGTLFSEATVNHWLKMLDTSTAFLAKEAKDAVQRARERVEQPLKKDEGVAGVSAERPIVFAESPESPTKKPVSKRKARTVTQTYSPAAKRKVAQTLIASRSRATDTRESTNPAIAELLKAQETLKKYNEKVSKVESETTGHESDEWTTGHRSDEEAQVALQPTEPSVDMEARDESVQVAVEPTELEAASDVTVETAVEVEETASDVKQQKTAAEADVTVETPAAEIPRSEPRIQVPVVVEPPEPGADVTQDAIDSKK